MKIYFLVLLAFFFTSCNLNDSPPIELLSFIEITSSYSSKVVYEDSVCLNTNIDFPLYYYSQDDNILEIYSPLNIDNNTLYLVASKVSLSGAAGGGMAGSVEGLISSVYTDTLSYWLSESHEIIKLKFKENNAVDVQINDTLSFSLKQNESRTLENEYISAASYNNGCIFNIKRTLNINNHTAIPRSNIKFINE